MCIDLYRPLVYLIWKKVRKTLREWIHGYASRPKDEVGGDFMFDGFAIGGSGGVDDAIGVNGIDPIMTGVCLRGRIINGLNMFTGPM
jgi:hypothetical protein